MIIIEKSIEEEDFFKELSEQDKSYNDRLVNITNELRTLNKEKAINLIELAELIGVSTKPYEDCISRKKAISLFKEFRINFPDLYKGIVAALKALPSVIPKG